MGPQEVPFLITSRSLDAITLLILSRGGFYVKDHIKKHQYWNKRILTYDDMAAVQPGNSQEPLVDVRTYSPTIIAEYEQSDMRTYTGRLIVVRDRQLKSLADQ